MAGKGCGCKEKAKKEDLSCEGSVLAQVDPKKKSSKVVASEAAKKLNKAKKTKTKK